MKKNISKLFSLALALIMALALAVPAMAVDVTITNGNAGATYDAYKIMSLVQNGENYAYTVETEWVDVLTAYFNITTGGKTDAAINNEILSRINGLKDDADGIRALADHLFANINEKTKAVENEDANFTVDAGYYLIVETTVTPAQGEVKSLVIMDTANHETIDIESKRDTVPVDKTTTADDDNDDTASVNVGDSVPFTITSKIPANVAEYEKYTFVITDTMTTGLSYNSDIEVVVGSTTVYDLTSDPQVTTDGVSVTVNDQVLTVDLGNYILANQETLGGADITITYSATLTAEAVTATDPVSNKVQIEYSNDPYTDDKGKTPIPEIEFELFDIDISKVDGKSSPLGGAKFQLTNDEGEYAIASGTDGDYKITGWTTITTNATSFESPADGGINIDGLAVGDYILTETKAPQGYNMLDEPIEINIAKDGSVTTSIASGAVSVITVVNQSGSELPSTGGMGTTIFYTLGGLLAVGAVVLLVTKKRMSNAEG